MDCGNGTEGEVVGAVESAAAVVDDIVVVGRLVIVGEDGPHAVSHRPNIPRKQ